MNIRVAVFEDNKLVRDALETILNGTNGFVCVGAYADGSQWEFFIKRSFPDVVLMDIELPGVSGIEITKNIAERFPDVKVLIQTVFSDNEKIFKALCAGASGYILKTDPPSKYLEAIREVVNGGAPMNTMVAKNILGFFTDKNILLVSPQLHDYDLTDRERELLKWLVQGYDLRQIGDKMFISYETVRTHVKHIYRKLHVANRTEAILKATQQKLL